MLSVSGQHSVRVVLFVDGAFSEADALGLDALDEHLHPLLLEVVLGELDGDLGHARLQAPLTDNLRGENRVTTKVRTF